MRQSIPVFSCIKHGTKIDSGETFDWFEYTVILSCFFYRNMPNAIETQKPRLFEEGYVTAETQWFSANTPYNQLSLFDTVSHKIRQWSRRYDTRMWLSNSLALEFMRVILDVYFSISYTW